MIELAHDHGGGVEAGAFPEEELEEVVGEVHLFEFGGVVFLIVFVVVGVVLEVVVLARTRPPQPSNPLPYRTVRGEDFLGFHEFEFGVESPPTRKPRINDVLQLPKGQRGLSNGRRYKDAARLQKELLVLRRLVRSDRKGDFRELRPQYGHCVADLFDSGEEDEHLFVLLEFGRQFHDLLDDGACSYGVLSDGVPPHLSEEGVDPQSRLLHHVPDPRVDGGRAKDELQSPLRLFVVRVKQQQQYVNVGRPFVYFVDHQNVDFVQDFDFEYRPHFEESVRYVQKPIICVLLPVADLVPRNSRPEDAVDPFVYLSAGQSSRLSDHHLFVAEADEVGRKDGGLPGASAHLDHDHVVILEFVFELGQVGSDRQLLSKVYFPQNVQGFEVPFNVRCLELLFRAYFLYDFTHLLVESIL